MVAQPAFSLSSSKSPRCSIAVPDMVYELFHGVEGRLYASGFLMTFALSLPFETE
jgi:hypothetical protein